MNRNRWTVLTGLALAFAFCLASINTSVAAPAPGQSNASAAFEKMKTLVGHWEATTQKGKALISYELIAGGASLLERDNIAGEAEMVTLYHLDGTHLRLTHYCTAGNQPTMQAEPFDAASNEIHFNFVSATNLASIDAGHMHQAVFKFTSPDEVSADWTWREKGKNGPTEHLQYHRVR